MVAERSDNRFRLRVANYHFYELRVTNSTLELHDLRHYYLYAYYWDQVRSVLITRNNRVRIRVKAITVNELWFDFTSRSERLRCQAYLECAHILERTPRVGLWNFVRYGGQLKLKPSAVLRQRLQEELLQAMDAEQKVDEEYEFDESLPSMDRNKTNVIICVADPELVIETSGSVIKVAKEREDSLSAYKLSPRPSFKVCED